MGAQDDGLPPVPVQFQDHTLHELGAFFIHIVCGLIKEDDPGIKSQCPRQSYPLRFPSRQFPRMAFFEA